MPETINKQFSSYKDRVESELKKIIPELGEKNVLRDACEYALLNGGKRFRPVITLMLAEALGHDTDVCQAGLAVELFHTASLVVDDLPCMDDDDLRRNKPSVHKKYGETVALLVSYTLISSGYGLLAKNSKKLRFSHRDTICTLALENAAFNTGLYGATGGQFLDVFPPDLSLPTLRDVIHRKSVSLFEISFVLGWLYGGGDVKQLDLVKQAALHFGMAFQLADDLGDVVQDAANNRKVNVAAVFGEQAARNMLDDEAEGYQKTLNKLQIKPNHVLNKLISLLI